MKLEYQKLSKLISTSMFEVIQFYVSYMILIHGTWPPISNVIRNLSMLCQIPSCKVLCTFMKLWQVEYIKTHRPIFGILFEFSWIFVYVRILLLMGHFSVDYVIQRESIAPIRNLFAYMLVVARFPSCIKIWQTRYIIEFSWN